MKSTPDGRWLIVQSPALGGQRSDALLVKLPPFPERDDYRRSDFISRTLPPIAIPETMEADNVVVRFGYDHEFRRTSRREACVKGNHSGNDFSFASEPFERVPCAGGCTVRLPAISQRVLYYQVQYRKQDQVVGAETNAAPVP